MPEFNTERAPSMKLETALLIYGSGAITRHKVEDGEIKPGETIDGPALRALLDGGPEEKTRDEFRWRSEFELAESATRRVWWTPPGIISVFIASKTKKVWFPGLVWCGHRSKRSLYLFAFRGKKAPTAETIVYRPAFGPADTTNHIHQDSAVCLGSMNPGLCTPKDWMTAFYDSNFKTDGNLPATPYEIKTRFKKLGTLTATLAGLGSRHEATD